MIDFEEGLLSPSGSLHLLSNLVKSGDAWNLQGFYGRSARRLIDGGIMDEQGNILIPVGDE